MTKDLSEGWCRWSWDWTSVVEFFCFLFGDNRRSHIHIYTHMCAHFVWALHECIYIRKIHIYIHTYISLFLRGFTRSRFWGLVWRPQRAYTVWASLCGSPSGGGCLFTFWDLGRFGELCCGVMARKTLRIDMHLCMCVYIFRRTFDICVYIYAARQLRTCAHTFRSLCLAYICRCVYVYINIKYVYIYVYLYMSIYMCLYVCIYMYEYIYYVYIYICVC